MAERLLLSENHVILFAVLTDQFFIYFALSNNNATVECELFGFFLDKYLTIQFVDDGADRLILDFYFL